MNSRRARSRRRAIQWLFLAMAVGIAAWMNRDFLARTVLGRTRAPEYPANAFYEVKRGDLLVSVTEDGALRALNETVVRNNLEGLNRIIRLVPEGAHVRKGDLLVELDSAGLRERLNELELSYQDRLFQLLQAEGNLRIQRSLAESEIKDSDLKVENDESDLEKYRDGDAPFLIRTVEARSTVLGEQVRIARERLARTQELFKNNNATRSELEADTLSLKREQLGLSQYEEDLRLIKKFDQPNHLRLLESKVQQARQERERVKQRTSNEVAQAEADVKTSERAVAALRDAVNNQKQRLENTKIFAPQDGLVVYASVSPFSSMDGGTERRRDDGRSRGGRGPGGGGDSGEFRGGGRRGGRMGSDTTGESGSSGRPGQGAGSTSVTGGGGSSGARGMAGMGPSAAGNSGGGVANSGPASGVGAGTSVGGAGGGSDGAAKAGASFVSYPSLRPSSSMKSSATNASSGSSGGAASAASSSSSASGLAGSGGNQGGSSASQFPGRTGFQRGSGSFGYEFYGTPGILEEGIMVRQRQELIRLPDVSRMIAEIKVHESRVRQIRPGLTALVRIESIPERRFKATVRRVAPLPDSQMSWLSPDLKVFPTDLLLDDPLPDLKPGVSARAEIVITNLTRVLSVPIQAVARLAGENVCFLQKGSTVVPVPVTTGWFNDRFQEITSGLKEGDRILLAPPVDDGIDEWSEEPEAASVEAVAASPIDRPVSVPTARPTDLNAETNRAGSSAGDPGMRRRDASMNEGEGQSERREGRGRERRRRDGTPPQE